MKRTLQLLCLAVLLPFGALMAQPANDNCADAAPLPYSPDPDNLTTANGDTRDATGDSNVPLVCSGSWFGDDVWFEVTMPADIPSAGIIVQTYFGTENDDVPAVGMAFYDACTADAVAYSCFSSDDPADDRLEISSFCLTPGESYKVRVWSGGSISDFSGTFRIACYPAEEVSTGLDVLWHETFADGLDGWTTFGTCSVEDSNANATWKYLPQGLLDQGAYIGAGFGISSESVCDGAVGVDSDYDDNLGIAGNFGAGPCPAPGQYILVSPAIYTADWDVAGLTITWTQAIRQYLSTFFVSFRTNTTGGTWTDWRDFQINETFELNGNAISNDRQRLFLGGAKEGDSLQIRFVYNANYYMWGIDDVRLEETEAHNMRSMSNWYAIAPAVNTPYSQVRPWTPLNDIYNAGAVAQTNVNLNFRVTNSGGDEVYSDDVYYGTIGPDSLAENENFPSTVLVPDDVMDTYTGVYTVTSDSATAEGDFDFSDNQNAFTWATTMDMYALETGFTRSIAVNDAIYDAGAPLSYTYGNYMSFPNGSGWRAKSVTWGISNPDEVANIPLNVILFKWDDLNGNQIAEAAERTLLGVNTVILDGTEGDDYIVETPLEGFNGPEDLELEDGGEYLVMVEYNALDQTFCFLLASEDYDYGGVVFSAEQAGDPLYASVLGFSPDGNIQGIDYEVTELDVNDERIYFGWDIVPLVRLNIEETSAVEDVLAADNLIDVFPNPASERINVKFDLTEVADEVWMQIFDASGRTIESRRLEAIQNDIYELNVTDYATGAYFLKVQTEAGSRSMRFVVQH